MGAWAGSEIDAWLRRGGFVVTASERAARAIAAAYHRARQAEGLTAWETPHIQDWSRFVRSGWAERTTDNLLLLNAAQEQTLWAEIAAADGRLATLLEGPRFRLAALAMEAHALLCAYAPRHLRTAARAGWANDAGAFSRWLTAFEDKCRAGDLVSQASLPLALLAKLQSSGGDEPARPPLLLAGFDRILPVQKAVFDAWGQWSEAAPGSVTADSRHFAAADDKAELAACALWCGQKLASNPQARLLVVTQDLTTRRGELERAFLGLSGSASAPLFEFSLGVPLGRTVVAHSAHLLLRWLSSPIAEHELDWLFSTTHAGASAEIGALQAQMRRLRSRGLEQPSWTLKSFVGAIPVEARSGPEVAGWVERMGRASRLLDEADRKTRSPLEWAELVPQLLAEAGWPGKRPLSSAEFQACERWQQALETTGSLGFDGRQQDWGQFQSALSRILEQTLFAPESREAPILIAGPAESAGLSSDAVWFLGATEVSWPASSGTHPLLPAEVQREAAMPHATAQLDWDLAEAVSRRLLASAGACVFSYARQAAGAENRHSRLIAHVTGEPEPLPADLSVLPSEGPLTVQVADTVRVPYPPGLVAGGSSVLTAQSQCAFKAFATARFGAGTWTAADAGLTPPQRGQLLHDVLHSVWAGPPRGLRSHADQRNVADINSFVSNHVRAVIEVTLRPALRQRLPSRYLQLEQERLIRLVAAWLEYEAMRVPFEVIETEARHQVQLAGLDFQLRLDRMDQLIDDTMLVIDYKSGSVSAKSWVGERPEDVQLPLYACFALEDKQLLGGLVFAKVRPGELAFAGRVGDAARTLRADLKGTSALIKNPMTGEDILDWRDHIEDLARNFVAGRAEVDPLDPPKTCKYCGLQTICRIQERSNTLADTDEEEGASESEEGEDE